MRLGEGADPCTRADNADVKSRSLDDGGNPVCAPANTASKGCQAAAKCIGPVCGDEPAAERQPRVRRPSRPRLPDARVRRADFAHGIAQAQIRGPHSPAGEQEPPAAPAAIGRRVGTFGRPRLRDTLAVPVTPIQ